MINELGQDEIALPCHETCPSIVMEQFNGSGVVEICRVAAKREGIDFIYLAKQLWPAAELETCCKELIEFKGPNCRLGRCGASPEKWQE